MGSNKTLGQVAYESWDLGGVWDENDDSLKDDWERAAQAVVELVIVENGEGLVELKEHFKSIGAAEERERLARAHDNEAKLEAARYGMSMFVVWHENQAKWLRAGGPEDFIVAPTIGEP